MTNKNRESQKESLSYRINILDDKKQFLQVQFDDIENAFEAGNSWTALYHELNELEAEFEHLNNQ
jgi:iron-sulfur cluster repair protein YtfE (RIC family)